MLAGDALADTDWVSLGQRALEAGDARAAVQLMAAATKKLPFAGVVWQNLGVLLLDAAAGDAAEPAVAPADTLAGHAHAHTRERRLRLHALTYTCANSYSHLRLFW